jgi:formate dehydrogenase major subunit
VTYPSLSPDDPGQAIVFGDGFPRRGARAVHAGQRDRRRRGAGCGLSDDPDHRPPAGALAHRVDDAARQVLDAVEPEAKLLAAPKTLRKLGVAPGGMVRLTTRRGEIEIMARADRAVAEDMVFLPFAYVEAAANILTNPALDPYGKIPEFKFSASETRSGRPCPLPKRSSA